ncbi:MFS transporter [Leucobacter sp. HY1908]
MTAQVPGAPGTPGTPGAPRTPRTPRAAISLTGSNKSGRVGGWWLTLFTLAWLVIWTAQLTPLQLLLPLQLDTPDSASGWVSGVVSSGIVLGVGGLAGVIAGPVAGSLSDRGSGHRRRPWALGGAWLAAGCLVLTGFSSGPWLVGASWVGVSVGIATASAAFTSMIADQLPVAQRGAASSAVGSSQALGIVLGVGAVVLLGLGVLAGYLLLAAMIAVVGTATALLLPDPPAPLLADSGHTIPGPAAESNVGFSPELSPQFSAEPTAPGPTASRHAAPEPTAPRPAAFGATVPRPTAPGPTDPELIAATAARSLRASLADRDFRWMLVGRLIVNVGNALGTALLLFFLLYGLGQQHAAAEENLLLLIVVYTVFVVLASIVVGLLSDRVGHRRLLTIACAVVQASAGVVILASPTFAATMVAAALMGVGYGGFSTVGLAFATDLLPSSRDNARDLGVVGVTASLGQLLGPVIGAGLVAIAGAFWLLFLGATVLSLVGAGLTALAREAGSAATPRVPRPARSIAP